MTRLELTLFVRVALIWSLILIDPWKAWCCDCTSDAVYRYDGDMYCRDCLTNLRDEMDPDERVGMKAQSLYP